MLHMPGDVHLASTSLRPDTVCREAARIPLPFILPTKPVLICRLDPRHRAKATAGGVEGMEKRHGREGCCPLEGSLAVKQEGSWGRCKPQVSLLG